MRKGFVCTFENNHFISIEWASVDCPCLGPAPLSNDARRKLPRLTRQHGRKKWIQKICTSVQKILIEKEKENIHDE